MRDLISKFFRYILTGGVAAIVDAVGFALLIEAGLAIAPACVGSFCAATLVNFMLSSRFVFMIRDATTHRFVRFLLVALVGLTVNLSVTLAGVVFFGLPPLVAKIIGIGTAFLLNFSLNLRVVFRAKV